MAQETEFADEIGDAAMLAAAQEIEALTESPGWKILMNQLRKDVVSAQKEFVEIEASDTAAVEACQRRIKRFQWFSMTPEVIMAEGFAKENLPREDEVPDYE